MCACGHLTQSVPYVVVDYVIHRAPDGFAGLCSPDAATRTWLKELSYLLTFRDHLHIFVGQSSPSSSSTVCFESCQLSVHICS